MLTKLIDTKWSKIQLNLMNALFFSQLYESLLKWDTRLKDVYIHTKNETSEGAANVEK